MHLERWIEQLIEEPFVRLFAGRLMPQDVVRHLVQALEDGERLGADGAPEVPGRYRIELNPEDLAALRLHHPDLDLRLRDALAALVERIDLRTHEPPAIILQPNPHLPQRGVSIMPANRVAPLPDQTRDLERARIERAYPVSAPAGGPRAYLIIKGDRTVDLSTATVRIGRALDNDIILEDRQVSRYHAQFRQRYGRYILQNLGSSGGTTVNGFAIREIVLRPGDLISLSGVDVIYAESEPLERTGGGQTQPIPRLTG
jgi:hypothetical protein